jgi:hypothetical protein
MQRILFIVAVLTLLAFAVGRAQAPTAPALPLYAIPRFQVVQLHPTAASEWSGLLDTQTGCTWAYATGENSEHTWQFIPMDSSFTRNADLVRKDMAVCYANLPRPMAVSPPSGEPH